MAERKARKRRSSSTDFEELKAKIYAKDDEMAARRKKRGPTGAAAEAQEAARKRRNAAKYEEEKAARAQRGPSGYGYSAHMMGGSSRSSGFNPRSVREELLVDYLLGEGFASDEKSAQEIAGAMSEEWKQSIVEQRVDVGGGRTVGPVAGAVHSLLTGNLPKSRTYIPPSTQTPTNRAPSIPASKDDSGKLTDFGKGGGRKKMKQTGMTVGQVERLGRRNVGDYSN